jgi:hypothetical protein
MAHQDYSQICPIFKEGVEHEVVFPKIAISVSNDVGGNAAFIFGREAEVIEVGAFVNMSSGASVCLSCVLGWWKDTSSSLSISTLVKIASCSIAVTSLSNKTGEVKTGSAYFVGSLASTSACFTSNEIIFIGVNGGPGNEVSNDGTSAAGVHPFIRYRDK